MYIINTMNRLYIIDFLRGCAIIMMIIFHIFLSFNLFNDGNYDLSNGLLKFIGLISRNLFIFLTGVSLYLSYKNNNRKDFKKKQFNRLITILIFSIIITILTYIVIPDKYIISGVLHYIFLSLFVLTLFINFFEIKYIYILFCLSILFFISNQKYYKSNNIILNYLFHLLGLNIYFKPSIDYFPIKNWLWKTILGFIFAKNINIEKIQNIFPKNFIDNIITKIGQKSLFIYILHIPLLYFSNKLI